MHRQSSSEDTAAWCRKYLTRVRAPRSGLKAIATSHGVADGEKAGCEAHVTLLRIDPQVVHLRHASRGMRAMPQG